MSDATDRAYHEYESIIGSWNANVGRSMRRDEAMRYQATITQRLIEALGLTIVALDALEKRIEKERSA